MLRALVLALLVANLGFFAWTEGWLGRWVAAPAHGEREPERVLRQVHPEAIRVIAPGAAMPVAAPASAAAPALACLESAPMGAAQAAATDAALRRVSPALPERSWVDETSEPPGSWLVYMGRYAGPEMRQRKEDELRRRHIDFEVVQAPAPLAPGLALGRYADKAAADEALAALTAQGVHTARVVQAAAPASTHVIRFAAADAAVVAQIAALRGEVDGQGFTACAKASPPASGAGAGR